LLSSHPSSNQSVHSTNHLVDEVLSVAVVTSLNKVIRFVSHSTGGTTQLERPQEVVGFLEVASYCENLVDEIFYANNITPAKSLLHDLVVTDRDALVVDLCEASFVNEISNGLEVWVAPSDERFHQPQHVQCRLVQFDEHAVVDLSQPQQLQGLLHFWRHLVDTTNTDHKCKFCFGRHVEVAVSFCHAAETNFVAFLCTVLLCVFLGTFVDNVSFLFQSLLLLDGGDGACRFYTLDIFLPFEDRLGDRWDLCVGHCDV